MKKPKVSRKAKRRTSRRGRRSPQYLAFVFKSTGDMTDLANLTIIDVVDNLFPECERLNAIQDLMTSRTDEVDTDSLRGIAWLIADIEQRIRMVLKLAVDAHQDRRKGK